MSTPATTAGFRYAREIYARMKERSEPRNPNELTSLGFTNLSNDNEPLLVFTGYITVESKNIGLSASAGLQGSRILSSMRCITQLKHGGPYVNSVYVLHYEPTDDDFEAFREREGLLTKRIVPSNTNVMSSNIDGLKTAVANLRNRVKELEELKARMEELERSVRSLQARNQEFI